MVVRAGNLVAVHQPHFFPWPPYIARVAHCDTFVVRDDVFYRKQYFHNRTRLLAADGALEWCSVPVHAHSRTAILDAVVDKSNQRRLRHIGFAIESHYRAAEHFGTVLPVLRAYMSELASPHTLNVSRMNIASVELLFRLLSLPIPKIVLASSLNLPPASRTERILGIVEQVRGDAYLTGWGASRRRSLLDVDLLKKRGIDTFALDRSLSVSIAPELVLSEGLSTLHWLFTRPAASIRDLLVAYRRAVIRL